MDSRAPIPGTTLFDGAMSQRGYALNAMCYSFNAPENRASFVADPDAYMTRYGLSAEQRAAVEAKDVLGMLSAGGNIYYLAKLAGIWGLSVQDVGAAQTGMTVDAFKEMLIQSGSIQSGQAAGAVQ